MRTMLLIVALLALTLGLDSSALAQEEKDQPLQEVFQTEMVYPQEKGALQFSAALIFGRVNKKFSNDLTLEYGLTQAWQVSLQWESFARQKTEGGLISRGSGDLRIGTKYSFMNIRGSHFQKGMRSCSKAIGYSLLRLLNFIDKQLY